MPLPLLLARLLTVLLPLAVTYGFAMWEPVRDVYSPFDKLAHAVVFGFVFFALTWVWQESTGWQPALLAAVLGGAVELQQMWLPGFTPSWEDWLAGLVGIAVAWAMHGAARQYRAVFSARARVALPPGHLPEAQFRAALEALPLVSVDWVLSNPAGEILVGQRLNAPALGAWFTPGGRIRKGEALKAALVRVATAELGVSVSLARAWADRGEAIGAWDHMYPDSAFDPALPTHYVNLPFWLAVTDNDLAALRLPVGEQHGHWAWVSVFSKVKGIEWHRHVQPYADWVARRLDQPHLKQEGLAHG